MMPRSRCTGSFATVLVLALALPVATTAQASRPRLVTNRIDENRLHTLSGNVRPQANVANDRGRVSDDTVMDHMLLLLQRSPEQEQALRQFIDQLHDPDSSNYHKWLTAEQFGQYYGPAQEDIDAVTGWLQSWGFTVNVVYPSGMTIDFSGTAGQVRQAFRTEIHHLDVGGEAHIANMSDPRLPLALAPVVSGIVSLHDFRPRAMKKPLPDYTYSSRATSYQAVVPADLATIYNLSPLFSAGTTGKGQKIALVEDSNLYSTNDWTTFRKTFGLSSYRFGSLTSLHPAPASGTNNCTDPGVATGSAAGDDGEATLDAEWASAAAPDAAILVASCASTKTTFGALIALQNLIGQKTPPAIISVSYGECEAESGATANAALNTVYQQAVAEGISVFAAAGDAAAADCDAGATAATHGIGVNAFASTPYNVAVGGTDFADTFHKAASTYWASTNDKTTYGSALSYIPEIPWNDSCANSLWTAYFGFSTPYGSSGFCASATAVQYDFLAVTGGGGGPSGCATGKPSTTDVVSGTCQGYAKPSWQAGVSGIAGDGVRDIPDIALFAADGGWGHYYVTCWSDTKNGGSPCTGAPSTWSGAGGTSFAAPIMAGIQALVNQKYGAQGNPNPVYYKLAAVAASNGTNCDSESGDSGTCIFHHVTLGDIDVNCTGSENCYGSTNLNVGGRGRHGPGSSSTSTNGVLSTSSGSYLPAYRATANLWNFATGLGSVNVANLVANWISGK